MKTFSTLIISVLLTSYSFAAELTGKFEIGNSENVPVESGNLSVAGFSEMALEPISGMDDSQRPGGLGLFETPLVSSLSRNFDKLDFSSDSFRGLYSAAPGKAYSTTKVEHGSGGLPPSNLFTMIDLGSDLLFNAGPITNGRSSVPESSTMLLLGLGLVGLAGYGGRKKFKR